jgi:hypothetical protein
VARAVAEVADADLIVGTGSGEPMGMMVRAWTGAAGTVATGGSLITPTYENLVDLVYSSTTSTGTRARPHGSSCVTRRPATSASSVTARAARSASRCGRCPRGRASTPASRTGSSATRCTSDANVASLASNARHHAAFGDWSAYYTRLVGNFVFERSDEYAFNTDLVTFRGKQRIDGDYIDAGAVVLLQQAV